MPKSWRNAASHRAPAGALLFFLLGLILGGSLARAEAAFGHRPAELTASLSAGRPFVLLVSPSDPGRIAATEAYAGWVSYLGEFLDRRPGGIAVLRVAPAEYRRRVSAPSMANAFATVFVRGDGRALVHPGLVLEPRVYTLGIEYLRGAAILPEARAFGLSEVRMRRK